MKPFHANVTPSRIEVTMTGPTPLHDCHFRVHNTDRGYIGRVDEYDDLHTQPHTKRLDALDDIISKTREKLRQLHADMTDMRKVAQQR